MTEAARLAANMPAEALTQMDEMHTQLVVLSQCMLHI